ncbi:Amino acid transporter [Vigna unguiculata]|uniref:Amino acid transporter n=1 Tax=Vigna unguiculata TaxID=3917 RepID=A0A4D6MI30_VIGUN|nr:Amino acid transporter [Vigna unguiculata]
MMMRCRFVLVEGATNSGCRSRCCCVSMCGAIARGGARRRWKMVQMQIRRVQICEGTWRSCGGDVQRTEDGGGTADSEVREWWPAAAMVMAQRILVADPDAAAFPCVVQLLVVVLGEDGKWFRCRSDECRSVKVRSWLWLRDGRAAAAWICSKVARCVHKWFAFSSLPWMCVAGTWRSCGGDVQRQPQEWRMVWRRAAVMMENAAMCSRERWKLPWFSTFLLNSPASCRHGGCGEKDPCKINSNFYTISFGIAEIILSQIPEFNEIWWLSIVAAVMSFTYSIIGLGLGIAKVVGNRMVKGSLTSLSISAVLESQKIWRSFQALGNIAFAYSYSMVLMDIQDTIKSPPEESKTMSKATSVSVLVMTIFYLLCGGFGYAAFGDESPGNLLTGFGFYNPYWLLDIANVVIVVHLLGSYQAMVLPFFNDIVGLIGAIAYWPLTVYFPVEMYIVQTKLPKWSTKWICLQMLSAACFVLTMVAAVGSIAGVVDDLKVYKPFMTNY